MLSIDYVSRPNVPALMNGDFTGKTMLGKQTRPESSQEKPQNCNEKTQLGSQIKYCGFS